MKAKNCVHLRSFASWHFMNANLRSPWTQIAFTWTQWTQIAFIKPKIAFIRLNFIVNANERKFSPHCVHLRSFAFICAHERKWTQFLIFYDFKLRERKLNAINKIAFICVHGLKIAKTCERKWTQICVHRERNLRSWTQMNAIFILNFICVHSKKNLRSWKNLRS